MRRQENEQRKIEENEEHAKQVFIPKEEDKKRTLGETAPGRDKSSKQGRDDDVSITSSHRNVVHSVIQMT